MSFITPTRQWRMKNGVPRLSPAVAQPAWQHRQDLLQVDLHRLGREAVAHADLHVGLLGAALGEGAPGLVAEPAAQVGAQQVLLLAAVDPAVHG